MRFLASKHSFQLVIKLDISQIHFTPDFSFKGGADVWSSVWVVCVCGRVELCLVGVWKV